MKVKNQYLEKFEYLHLCFNKWPSIEYKLCVSLVLWNHNNGERCWLGNVQKTIIDTLHKEGHRGSILKGVAVQGVLYQSILNAKLTGRKKLNRKMCTSNRDARKLENTVKQSRFKNLGELHQEWTEAGVSASRVTTLRHLQEKGWPEGRYQSNLGFHYTWAVPQADCLHATPRWCSNSCKRRPNKRIECIEMNILFRSLTFLFKISFFYWSYVIF